MTRPVSPVHCRLTSTELEVARWLGSHGARGGSAAGTSASRLQPAVCKFPTCRAALAGESIQSPVFFRSPNVEKRIALLPSAYRNLECTA